MNKKILIIIGIILLTAILAGGFYLWSQNKTNLNQPNKQKVVVDGKQKQNQVNQQEQKKQQAKNDSNSAEEQIDTSNWKTYRNEEYGFEVKYPEDWIVDEKTYKFEYSWGFEKIGCDGYKKGGCEDGTVSISKSRVPDSTLRTISSWAWNIPKYKCDDDSGYGKEQKIPVLNFNVPYTVQACENYDFGYMEKWYMLSKDDSKWLFTIACTNQNNKSKRDCNFLIGKTILETFRFIKD